MQTLRFGDTFIAMYPNNAISGTLNIIGRDRSNRGRPCIISVNHNVMLRHAGDTPIIQMGEIFEAEADKFQVVTVEGFAHGIDRIDDTP